MLNLNVISDYSTHNCAVCNKLKENVNARFCDACLAGKDNHDESNIDGEKLRRVSLNARKKKAKNCCNSG